MEPASIAAPESPGILTQLRATLAQSRCEYASLIKAVFGQA